MRPAFLFEACRVRAPGRGRAARRPGARRARPRPRLGAQPQRARRLRGGARAPGARGHRPRLRRAAPRGAGAAATRRSCAAATLGEAAAAVGLALDEHVVAALNGDQITRDAETPLAAGDAVAFLAADAGG